MTHTKTTVLFASVLLASSMNTAMSAEAGNIGATKSQTLQGALSPKQRSTMTKQFVKIWGPYVQTVYGIDVRTWSSRMTSQFASADSDNFRNALTRDTLEGALNTLGGTGHRMSDERVITLLAKKQIADARSTPSKTLGVLSNDLVYTPLQPCRIVDTRQSGGAIPAASSRDFKGMSASSFTAQGGSASDCGTLNLVATALALNVTAVGTTGLGFTTVYPYGTARPLAASINYNAGFNVNNALIVQVPNPLDANEFTIYTSAQAHYVVDIVGYFAPPVATALECQNTAYTIVYGTYLAVAPSCAAGYTATGTNCISSGGSLERISDGLCRTSNVPASLSAGRTCCRVPGR